MAIGKLTILLTISIVFAFQKVEFNAKTTSIDLVYCSPGNDSNKCIFSNFVIESSQCYMRQVLYSNGTKMDTSNLKNLRFVNLNDSVKFIPAGIKENFPNITAIAIIKCGLNHLEREDMRQFGDDLIYANFKMNSLTALEGDVFHYNSKIEQVILNDNPFKFINPYFFRKLKSLKFLKNFHMKASQGSECNISRNLTFKSINEGWNCEKCDNENKKNENLRRISDRADFFILYYSGTLITDEIYDDRHHSDENTTMNSTFIVLILIISLEIFLVFCLFVLHCKKSSNNASIQRYDDAQHSMEYIRTISKPGFESDFDSSKEDKDECEMNYF